jgi:DNA-binding NtrC family response regulator
LALDDQQRLLDWLQECDGRARVISTTSATLLPLMESGAFLHALYYRLNTVCLVHDAKQCVPSQ